MSNWHRAHDIRLFKGELIRIEAKYIRICLNKAVCMLEVYGMQLYCACCACCTVSSCCWT